jgi:hypothetical protein
VDQIEVWEQAVDVLRECGVFSQQDKDMEFVFRTRLKS